MPSRSGELPRKASLKSVIEVGHWYGRIARPKLTIVEFSHQKLPVQRQYDWLAFFESGNCTASVFIYSPPPRFENTSLNFYYLKSTDETNRLPKESKRRKRRTHRSTTVTTTNVVGFGDGAIITTQHSVFSQIRDIYFLLFWLSSSSTH